MANQSGHGRGGGIYQGKRGLPSERCRKLPAKTTSGLKDPEWGGGKKHGGLIALGHDMRKTAFARKGLTKKRGRRLFHLSEETPSPREHLVPAGKGIHRIQANTRHSVSQAEEYRLSPDGGRGSKHRKKNKEATKNITLSPRERAGEKHVHRR